MKEITKTLQRQDFWIEYISIYTSIFIVTIFVQVAMLKSDVIILLFCLIKSLVTTIPNVTAIMYGRRKKVVQRHWFVETILYTVCSFPYAEITIIYIYIQDIGLIMYMSLWYIIAYFGMGLFIKSYLRLANKVITKIFEIKL